MTADTEQAPIQGVLRAWARLPPSTISVAPPSLVHGVTDSMDAALRVGAVEVQVQFATDGVLEFRITGGTAADLFGADTLLAYATILLLVALPAALRAKIVSARHDD